MRAPVDRLSVHTTSDGLTGDQLAILDAIEASRDKLVGVLAALPNSPPVVRLVSDLGAYMCFDSNSLPPLAIWRRRHGIKFPISGRRAGVSQGRLAGIVGRPYLDADNED